ncbi:MAG: carbohydrate kinase (thermoresistant glucokinase family) [Candidatus Azotimanducaceae bacterium]|jgi:carbohydrate kinase (thermoresistant glucokinase family)
MIVVVWGVSGCGKSTVGKQLADKLGWIFHDADDFHPVANVEKMRQGIPLQDDDRYPWFAQLAELLRNVNDQNHNAVLACSALKQDYRDRLGINHEDIRAVHLSGSQDLIRTRLIKRNHEFMSNSLIQSQFAVLEPSAQCLSLDIAASPQDLCQSIIEQVI